MVSQAKPRQSIVASNVQQAIRAIDTLRLARIDIEQEILEWALAQPEGLDGLVCRLLAVERMKRG